MSVTLRGTIESAILLNAKHLEEQLAAAFIDWLEEDVDGTYMADQFLSEKWEYPPPPTIRKQSPPAGNPRNIYDTGALFRSGRRSFQVDRNDFSVQGNWHWDAKNSSGDEYAWFVHEGEGPYARAPRPWTDEISTTYLFNGSDVKRQLEERITVSINL